MWKFIYSWMLYTWGGLHRYFGNQNVIRHEFERAVHYFSRAYEVDPTFVNARLQRAVLLSRELGQHEAALVDLNGVLDVEPDNQEALFNRAMTYQTMGQYVEALTDFERFLTRSQPGDGYADEARRITAVLRDIIQDNHS